MKTEHEGAAGAENSERDEPDRIEQEHTEAAESKTQESSPRSKGEGKSGLPDGGQEKLELQFADSSCK